MQLANLIQCFLLIVNKIHYWMPFFLIHFTNPLVCGHYAMIKQTIIVLTEKREAYQQPRRTINVLFVHYMLVVKYHFGCPCVGFR